MPANVNWATLRFESECWWIVYESDRSGEGSGVDLRERKGGGGRGVSSGVVQGWYGAQSSGWLNAQGGEGTGHRPRERPRADDAKSPNERLCKGRACEYQRLCA